MTRPASCRVSGPVFPPLATHAWAFRPSGARLMLPCRTGRSQAGNCGRGVVRDEASGVVDGGDFDAVGVPLPGVQLTLRWRRRRPFLRHGCGAAAAERGST